MALSGVMAPVVTPFDRDLQPDPARFLQHCRALLEEGCSALAIFGTTSEANSLSVEERERLLDHLLDNGIPPERLLPGTGCCSLSDTIRLTKKAARCAGVLMLPPFYYKGVSEEGLFRSYARVIEKLPDARVLLYHIPQVAQVGIPVSLIVRLKSAFPRSIRGIKDSGGDFENTKAVLRAMPKDFDVFVGSEKFLTANLREGGAGCITATANVNARAIVQAFHERSDEAQKRIDAVRSAYVKLPMIPGLKETLARRTGNADWRIVRPPLVELTDEQRRLIPA
ncbi:MAG TPA: dihydrodipicolinate synthase family protein [Myxococcales bacterium]|nr:dihydrodipicolinate synthase family protein [Myxococcales bacterium]